MTELQAPGRGEDDRVTTPLLPGGVVVVAVDGEDGQVYAGERIEEVGAGGGGGLEDLVGLGFLCLCSAALLGGALLGTFLGLGALGTRLGGEALVGKVSPDIVTNPKLHRPGPQREPAENLYRSVLGSAGGIILVEQVAREEDEITARRWSALASGSPQRLQSKRCTGLGLCHYSQGCCRRRGGFGYYYRS